MAPLQAEGVPRKTKDPYALPSGSFPISGTRTRGWNGESVENVSGEMQWRALTSGREEGRCVLSVKANLRDIDDYISHGVGLDRDSVERLLAGDRMVQETLVQEFSGYEEEYNFTLERPEQPPAEAAAAPPAAQSMHANLPAPPQPLLPSAPAQATPAGDPARAAATHRGQCGASARRGRSVTGVRGRDLLLLCLLSLWTGLAGVGLGVAALSLLDKSASWGGVERQAAAMLQLGAAAILILIGLVALVWVIHRIGFDDWMDEARREDRK